MIRNIAYISLLALFAMPVRTSAQQVELQLDSRTLQEGEIVELTLTCTNTGEPHPPELSAPPGLRLELVNSIPMRSSMISIIGGKRTEKATHTFALRLTGQKEGSYILPPITIQADGATYQTDPITIAVLKPEADQLKDGDKMAFARIAVQPVSLYVTQTLETTLTLAIRKYESNGQPVELGNLLQLVDARGSDLSVFGTRFSSSEAAFTDSAGKRHEYMIYRQTKQIRADQVGTLKIGPVFFKIDYPVSLRRSLFGRYEVNQSRREIARAPAIDVEVKAPPLQDRPDDYLGAVGQYKMEVSARPQRVELGQPITLTIAFKGDPLDSLVGPDLTRLPELAGRFDFSAEESPGEREGDALVFRRAIFPRREGSQTIPPVSWSFFDPATESYVTLNSSPISIQVDAGTSSDSILADSSTATPSSLTRTVGGISPNVVDPRKVLAGHDVAATSVELAAVMTLPPIVYLAALLVSWRRARARGDAHYARRRSAVRNARRRIAAAANDPTPEEALQSLANAVSRLVADRLGLPPGTRTPSEIHQLIIEHGGDSTLADQAEKFLSACETARFARMAAMTPTVAQTRALELVRRLEAALR